VLHDCQEADPGDGVWSETYGEPPKLPPGAEAAPGAAPPGSSEDPVLNGKALPVLDANAANLASHQTPCYHL
jgi:hypothetical protein